MPTLSVSGCLICSFTSEASIIPSDTGTWHRKSGVRLEFKLLNENRVYEILEGRAGMAHGACDGVGQRKTLVH